MMNAGTQFPPIALVPASDAGHDAWENVLALIARRHSPEALFGATLVSADADMVIDFLVQMAEPWEAPILGYLMCPPDLAAFLYIVESRPDGKAILEAFRSAVDGPAGESASGGR